jgi:hypothetical protein
MLYRAIIAVCCQIYTKHLNTVCGQNVECVNVKPGGTCLPWRVEDLQFGCSFGYEYSSTLRCYTVPKGKNLPTVRRI